MLNPPTIHPLSGTQKHIVEIEDNKRGERLETACEMLIPRIELAATQLCAAHSGWLVIVSQREMGFVCFPNNHVCVGLDDILKEHTLSSLPYSECPFDEPRTNTNSVGYVYSIPNISNNIDINPLAPPYLFAINPQ